MDLVGLLSKASNSLRRRAISSSLNSSGFLATLELRLLLVLLVLTLRLLLLFLPTLLPLLWARLVLWARLTLRPRLFSRLLLLDLD